MNSEEQEINLKRRAKIQAEQNLKDNFIDYYGEDFDQVESKVSNKLKEWTELHTASYKK